ncbi:hypothetical protein QR680_001435 [Steinernema hermaphroditum]|uniref:Helitron helicase-like domain-containing protein n=1 Tax=Steinernema hermaphroditum TaxID=289476 RepID=A0AA39GY93_9BILA|nr:hypothetical protein QR680_001435 [Steinernema hermaphroditum]
MRAESAESLREVFQNRFRRITNRKNPLGKIFLLPYTYPGGQAYMQRKFLDAMAITSRDGAPSFFITFTGNSTWHEVLHERKHEKQSLTELYDKLDKLKNDLKGTR